MEAQNAYSPPQGDLTDQQAVAFNQPKFLSLSGRIGRLRYLAYGSGLMLVFYGVLAALMAAFGASILAGGSGSFIVLGVMGLLYIPLMVFSWGYIVRRLNDLNKSGWLSLLMLVPLANVGLLLYVLFGRGTEGNNNYGAPPPPNTTGVIALSCVLPAIAIIGILAAIALPAYMAGSQSETFEQGTYDDSNSAEDAATDAADAAAAAADEAANAAAPATDDADAVEPEDNATDNAEDNYGEEEPADEGSEEPATDDATQT